MPLKVQTCLAQACVVPSGTNATDQCDRPVRPIHVILAQLHCRNPLEFTGRPFSRPVAPAALLATTTI